MSSEGCALTCLPHSEWQYNLARVGTAGKDTVPGRGDHTAMDLNKTATPAGVFVPTDGLKYYPTVHGMERTAVDAMKLGLVAESSYLTTPAVINVGSGAFVVTNTGAAALKVGEGFRVAYPTAADCTAQTNALQLLSTRNCHGNWRDTERTWGGLMATVPDSPNRRDRIVEGVNRELTGTGRVDGRCVMSLGKFMSRCYALSTVPMLNAPRTVYDNVTATGTTNVSSATVRTAAATYAQQYAELCELAADLLTAWDPPIKGTVLHSVLGNAAEIPPGGQFHAHVQFV